MVLALFEWGKLHSSVVFSGFELGDFWRKTKKGTLVRRPFVSKLYVAMESVRPGQYYYK